MQSALLEELVIFHYFDICGRAGGIGFCFHSYLRKYHPCHYYNK